MLGLADIIKFLELLQAFRKIERVVSMPDDPRPENDVEHSYQLAMLAWYIVDREKLKLDIGALIKYALVHDLVEAYAGDTYAYTKDKALRDSKDQREGEAFEKIKAKFGEFEELIEIIHKYETHADAESKFIYALDKVAPIFNIYMAGGRQWHESGITLAELLDYKTSKVAVSPEVTRIYEELVTELRRREGELFPASSKNS